MAAKFVLFLTFVVAIVVGAELNCDCNNDDTKDLWEYLTKISQDFDDLTNEEKEMFSVLPGFLSPLFECNCLNNRRKRSITPSVPPHGIVPMYPKEAILPGASRLDAKKAVTPNETPLDVQTYPEKEATPSVTSRTVTSQATEAVTTGIPPSTTVPTYTKGGATKTKKPIRRPGNKIRYGTRSCPVGYVRIVYWCVEEDKID